MRVSARLFTIICLALATALAGCETADTRSTRTERTAVSTAEGEEAVHTGSEVSRNIDDDGDTTVVDRTTVTEAEVEEEEDKGLLQGAIEFIGNVLAFPFRVIGGLLDLIF